MGLFLLLLPFSRVLCHLSVRLVAKEATYPAVGRSEQSIPPEQTLRECA